MIRFSAFLVVVAVGPLVGGVVTSKLLLVYIAIGVSGVALLALGVGAAVNWRELTGKPKTAAAEASAQGPAPTPAPASRPSRPLRLPSRPRPDGSRDGFGGGRTAQPGLRAIPGPRPLRPAAGAAHAGDQRRRRAPPARARRHAG